MRSESRHPAAARRLAILTVTLLAAFGCGGAESPESATEAVRTFAFVVNTPSTFWSIAEAGLRKAAAEFGVEVEMRIPQTGAVDEQQQILQDLLARQVDGIAISPIDPNNMTRLLNDVASRTLLITHDSDAADSKRLAYIGTDNFEAGRVAGLEIRRALPQGGDIILFVGRLDAQNAQDRKRGIEDVLAGTDIHILDTRVDQADQARAQENAEAMIVAHPGLAGMVGLWSYNGPAIVSAVRAAGLVGQIKVVCFDEEEATLQAIRDGVIESTIVQKPFEFGYQSIRLLDELSRGDHSRIPANGLIDTGVTVVSSANVVEFSRELAELIQ